MRAEATIRTWMDAAVEAIRRAEAAEAALASTQEENRRLVEALEPFRRANRALGDEPGPYRFETGTGHVVIDREDFRRAARSLATKPTPDHGAAG